MTWTCRIACAKPMKFYTLWSYERASFLSGFACKLNLSFLTAMPTEQQWVVIGGGDLDMHSTDHEVCRLPAKYFLDIFSFRPCGVVSSSALNTPHSFLSREMDEWVAACL